MDYSIYIIKPNTPESKLLSHAGFKRDQLEVTKWKGRQQSHGGFGRVPCEWRLTGMNNVKSLCETIVRILEKRKSTLNSEEKRALNRAEKTLQGIDNINAENYKRFETARSKEQLIILLLSRLYPTIDQVKIKKISVRLSNKTYDSFEVLLQDMKFQLSEIQAIEEARKIFVSSIQS